MAPFLVEADDLVDDLHTGEAAALRLTDALGVEPLFSPEYVDVQHRLFFLRDVDEDEEGEGGKGTTRRVLGAADKRKTLIVHFPFCLG